MMTTTEGLKGIPQPVEVLADIFEHLDEEGRRRVLAAAYREKLRMIEGED